MEELTSESVLYKKPVDPANWVGLMKSEPLLEYLRVSTDRTGRGDACKGAKIYKVKNL